jgi:hypothetical protein
MQDDRGQLRTVRLLPFAAACSVLTFNCQYVQANFRACRRLARRSAHGPGSVAGMLLAEDLLLLVTDDTSGRLVTGPAAHVDAGLGGANLIELTLLNKVDLSGKGDPGRPGRIIVRDPFPVGDDVLDAALGILIRRQGSKASTVSTVIRPLGKNLRQALYERLAGSGVIRAGQGRTLGIFPARTWPAQDARHEEQVRQLVTQALVQQTAPDARTAALIALLHALRCEHKVIYPGLYQLSRRQLRARAEKIAKGNWASEAVRKVISEICYELTAPG